MRSGGPVTPDHYATLDYMASLQFRRVKDLFTQTPGIGDVYFRPRRDGVVVVDLHPDSVKPHIGLGDEYLIRRGSTVSDLLSTMPARANFLRQQRAQKDKPSPEFQFETSLMRGAQAQALRLPGFPSGLCFVTSQWRIDGLGGRPKFVDLVALDLRSRSFVLIELKGNPDPAALQQAEPYLEYFKQNSAELSPFFAQMAKVMGILYNRLELATLDPKTAAGFNAVLAAWPDAGKQIVVVGSERLLNLPPRSSSF